MAHRLIKLLLLATTINILVALIASQIAPIGEFNGETTHSLSLTASVGRLDELTSLPDGAQGTLEDLAWAQRVDRDKVSLVRTGRQETPIAFSVSEVPRSGALCTYTMTMYDSAPTNMTNCRLSLPIAREALACGWPFRSFHATRLQHLPPDIWTHDLRSVLPKRIRPQIPLTYPIGTSAMPTGSPRPLPIMPMWPGLIANTVTYACALYVPLLVTRHRRARRGECPKCGYSRSGLADGSPCPECGVLTNAPAACPTSAPPQTPPTDPSPC